MGVAWQDRRSSVLAERGRQIDWMITPWAVLVPCAHIEDRRSCLPGREGMRGEALHRNVLPQCTRLGIDPTARWKEKGDEIVLRERNAVARFHDLSMGSG